jgi:hypothetical protein
LEGLARALGEAFDYSALETRQFLGEITKSSLGLRDFAQRLLTPGEQLIVVVDQFEELFRYRRQTGDRGRVESTAFVKLLLAATGNSELVGEPTDAPVWVVLTMRSDYLGKCAQFRGLPEALNDAQYLVPRVTRDQQREAIEGPITFAGAQITGRLVERILNDAGDHPDQLPVLQHVLLRVWEESAEARDRNEALDLPHYEHPAVGGITEALNQDAENAFKKLTSFEQKAIARRMFQRLVEPGTEAEETRRPTRLSEIAAICQAPQSEVLAVVEVFCHRGFLTRSDELAGTKDPTEKEDPIIDISHESLIRQWASLREWVEHEARSAAIYSRLADSALNHRALYRGPDLAEALRWKQRESPNREWASRYNRNSDAWDHAMKFLRRSRMRPMFLGYVLAVLVVSGVAAQFFALYRSADRERQQAQEAKQESDRQGVSAEISESEAQHAQQEAERQRKRAEEFAAELLGSIISKNTGLSVLLRNWRAASGTVEGHADHAHQSLQRPPFSR